MLKSESALIMRVPEAEALVGAFRERFDPSAALGVPAHITLLYPFVEPRQIDRGVLGSLADCFDAFAPIDFALREIRRFPAETLYLAPEPDEPFRALTMAIWKRFPATPPYGGIWPDIVPHLSLGRITAETELDTIMSELSQKWRGALPIRARAADVVLIENTTGRWAVGQVFELGG